jgi:hypothetical protein
MHRMKKVNRMIVVFKKAFFIDPRPYAQRYASAARDFCASDCKRFVMHLFQKYSPTIEQTHHCRNIPLDQFLIKI